MRRTFFLIFIWLIFVPVLHAQDSDSGYQKALPTFEAFIARYK